MKRNLYVLGLLILFFVASCKKNELVSEKLISKTKDSASIKNLTTFSLMSTAASATTIENHDDDSIERKTVLGNQLTNPYLIPNMQQAYSNLGITNVAVNVTHLYVRFQPSNVDQLDLLTSTLEAQNLEPFDTPVDYEVTYEGDYYQDPSIPDEQITWQYAVVPSDFQFPAGITYQTIAQIHIPGNDYTAVETEAERLATNAGLQNNSIKPTPNVPQCDPDYHWNYSGGGCVPNNCPVGYSWNGRACVADTPQPTGPPAPATDASVPGGGILVYDTQTTTNRPVRKAIVVARRWFKIERGFTDNNGHYQLTKRFKNNVRVLVKFKNGDAEVRGLRGIRLWQMLFPIKKAVGLFSGDKSNISYTFPLYTNPGSKGNRYWAGATTHNSVQDYRDYAPTEGIGLPPTEIKIILNNVISGAGASPMWNKRNLSALPQEFVFTFLTTAITPIAGGVAALIVVLKHQIDIAVSYQHQTSDALKETVYHELTHAAHYAA